MMVCKTCLADCVVASAVVQMKLTRSTGSIDAWVCDRCRGQGRITRATCRTFILIHSDTDPASRPENSESRHSRNDGL
jgi:hypothetical protein